MSSPNEINLTAAEVESGVTDQTLSSGSATDQNRVPEIATRFNQNKRRKPDQKQLVIMVACGIVIAILAFVLVSLPHKERPRKPKLMPNYEQNAAMSADAGSRKSSVPITESGAVHTQADPEDLLREQDVQRTAALAQVKSPANHAEQQASRAGQTLAAIPPFDTDHDWQAPPFNSAAATNTETDNSMKAERDVLQLPSLVFIRNRALASSRPSDGAAGSVGLGLPIGTRLRARLETVATSAIKLPAIAVIEYNYEQNGQIVIPAGTKALGRVEQADRSGFISIRFDSLLMPDGTEVPFDGVGTDLGLAPLRGRVEGKNTGKSLLARSLSGVGQAGALFAGRGTLNQPFSEGDLIRERVSTNIGDESDREITHLSTTEHIVVSVPAGTPIYVVLDRTTPKLPSSTPPAAPTVGPSAQNQELIQILQNQLSSAPGSSGRTGQ